MSTIQEWLSNIETVLNNALAPDASATALKAVKDNIGTLQTAEGVDQTDIAALKSTVADLKSQMDAVQTAVTDTVSHLASGNTAAATDAANTAQTAIDQATSTVGTIVDSTGSTDSVPGAETPAGAQA